MWKSFNLSPKVEIKATIRFFVISLTLVDQKYSTGYKQRCWEDRHSQQTS